MVASSVIQFDQLISIYIGNSDGQFSCTSKPPSLGTTVVVPNINWNHWKFGTHDCPLGRVNDIYSAKKRKLILVRMC